MSHLFFPIKTHCSGQEDDAIVDLYIDSLRLHDCRITLDCGFNILFDLLIRKRLRLYHKLIRNGIDTLHFCHNIMNSVFIVQGFNLTLEFHSSGLVCADLELVKTRKLSMIVTINSIINAVSEFLRFVPAKRSLRKRKQENCRETQENEPC